MQAYPCKAWIKAGCDYIDKSVFVLDRFHKNKYINDNVSYMMDSELCCEDMLRNERNRNGVVGKD